MLDETNDQKLRAMAEHRGFKLVKSRRRKPGAGDYGKFGLTQADGRPLLGISKAGLTASAEDIEAYLRDGSVSTWKASAESVPARVAPTEKPKKTAHLDDDVERAPFVLARGGSTVARKANHRDVAAGSQERKSVDMRSSGRERANQKSTGSGSAAAEGEPNASMLSNPPTVPALNLRVRVAKPADAVALATLLRQLADVEIDERGVARNLQAARKAKGGMVIAERDKLVGCCAWSLIHTIQHGPVGRITMILVDEAHRRRGIATALIEATFASFREAGCSQVEAISDIEIRNAHNFFRTLKFEQTSYRFARALDGDN